MTPKAGHTFTAGPCVATGDLSVIGDTVHWCGEVVQVAPDGGYRGRIAGIQSCNHIGGIGQDEAKANAHLIAEAFTVAHETGLTPRQLAERRDELLEALRSIEAALRKDSRDKTVCSETVEYHLDGQAMFAAINQARAALSKATAGGAV